MDNYIIHSSKRTKRFLAQFGDRVVLHFLPPYCPDDYRIERVWLDLHANVTRNHRCKTIEELMIHVVAFMRAYNQRKKLNPSLKPAIAASGSRSVVEVAFRLSEVQVEHRSVRRREGQGRQAGGGPETLHAGEM